MSPSSESSFLLDGDAVDRPVRRAAVADRKRVDHTASLGGGELALLSLVQVIDRKRFTPIVVLGSTGPLVDRLAGAGIETHVLPLASTVTETRKDDLGVRSLLRLRDAVGVLSYIVTLARTIRANRIDIVHSNSLKADVIGGLAARLAGRPVIWHIRDRIVPEYMPGKTAAMFRWLCRVIPDYVLANSYATLETLSLQKRKPCGVAYSGIVPEGVGRWVLGAGEQENRAGASLPTPNTQHLTPNTQHSTPSPVVGLVGRISPWKGQHVFLQAASLVHARFPRARFQIIGAALYGEHAYEEEIRAMTSSLGLSEHVEFTGFRNDVANLIADLDILVHASTIGEPFGQVVVQGMAAGKPVVATNGGGVPEIVQDGVTGLLVPMNDAEAMAEAIRSLLEKPEQARTMGHSGRQRVYTHFTIARTLQQVEAAYDDVWKRRGRKRPSSAAAG